MFAASLNKSSQVLIKHAKAPNDLIELDRSLFGEKTCEKNRVLLTRFLRARGKKMPIWHALILPRMQVGIRLQAVVLGFGSNYCAFRGHGHRWHERQAKHG